jgi:fructan beta-fructosidase
VSWSDIPGKDGRRIYIGWMSNWNYAQTVPTGKWRSAMTIPRKLELKNSIAGVRLFSTPVKEMIDLRKSEQNLDPGKESKYKISGLNELIFKVDLNETLSDNFGVIFFNSKHDSLFFGFDKLRNQFYIDRTRSGNISFSKDFPKKHVAPRIVNDNELEIRLFLDYSSLELFADSGSVTMTELFFPQENFNQMIFFQKNGIAEIKNVELMDLSSIWN